MPIRIFSVKNKPFYLLRRYPASGFILKWLWLAALAGICAGCLSAFLLLSLEWATQTREAHLWLIALLPVCGLLIGLLYHHFGKGTERGNNLLLESIHDPKKIIPFRMAPFVLLGTVATHLFGGSAGREGTALQMSGAWAHKLSKLLRLKPRDHRMLLITGIGAGFGSVFGTPIAGTLFGLEVFFIGQITYAALFPAFVASVIADQVTRLFPVQHIHYPIMHIPDISLPAFFYALLAGIIFGITAAGFIKTTHLVTRISEHTIAYPPLRPMTGGIIVALIVLCLHTTAYIGLGIPTIVAAFSEPLPAYSFLLKILLTAITLGMALKGGEVTPLFFIGATLGNALSCLLPLPMDLLAGMGFVAVFAGAANTPLACCIMGMELFGMEAGIWISLACIVAYLFSGHNSIYRAQVIGSPKNPYWLRHTGRDISQIDHKP